MLEGVGVEVEMMGSSIIIYMEDGKRGVGICKNVRRVMD